MGKNNDKEMNQRLSRGKSVNDAIYEAFDEDYDDIVIIGIKDDELVAHTSSDHVLKIVGAMEYAKLMILDDID